MSAATASPAPRTRDAARSRRAVLDAAERLFAERGFDGATMQEIGAAAGLSRGAPAYIFGSKRELYGAVLERVFEQRHERLAPALATVAEVTAAGPAAAGSAAAASAGEARVAALERSLRPAVAAYIDFLAERPTFVRLMQWEALAGGDRLRATPHRSSAVADLLAATGEGEGDRAQMVLSFVALCFFPFEHAGTMLAGVGADARDPGFLTERVTHVTRMLAATIADAERRG